MAQDKTQGPDTTFPFLGITLDTLKLEARLPQDKKDKCRSLLRNFFVIFICDFFFEKHFKDGVGHFLHSTVHAGSGGFFK